MPKTKSAEKKSTKSLPEEKIIEIEDEVKEGDVELVAGDELEDELEDDAILDDEEIDPFKDKWEE